MSLLIDGYYKPVSTKQTAATPPPPPPAVPPPPAGPPNDRPTPPAASATQHPTQPKHARTPPPAARNLGAGATTFGSGRPAHPTAALSELAHRHGRVLSEPIRALADSTPLLHAPGPSSPTRKSRPYALPFSLSSPFAGVDQGVDYTPRAPVRAIAPGRIYHISGPGSFGGGTGQAVYEHLDHPITIRGRKYYNVYYAEQRPLVRQGQHVAAGQRVMAAGSDELGFASPDERHPRPQGPLVVVPATGQHGRYTEPTTEGRDFYEFLHWISRT